MFTNQYSTASHEAYTIQLLQEQTKEALNHKQENPKFTPPLKRKYTNTYTHTHTQIKQPQ